MIEVYHSDKPLASYVSVLGFYLGRSGNSSYVCNMAAKVVDCSSTKWRWLMSIITTYERPGG